MRVLLAAAWLVLPTYLGAADLTCLPAAIYSPCEVVLDLPPSAAAAHPDPYATVQLHAEFRSPRHQTYLMPAFWDGGNRMVVRFSPVEAGEWDFRLSGNIAEFEGKSGKFTATPAETYGFVRTANVRHFATTETAKPHLWMGDVSERFGFIERASFDRMLETRAKQKFNHIRGLVIGGPEDGPRVFPGKPDPEYFRELDSRVLAINRKGIVADLVLAAGAGHLSALFPDWARRERYLRYVVSRYAAMNVTWQIAGEFEDTADGRDLLKQAGAIVKKLDPHRHPRSTGTVATAAPLLPDGWMDYVTYRSADDQLGAVEHQFYPSPAVNIGFAAEDSGAGKRSPEDAGTDEFRRRLWNSWMNGQYVTYANTGTSGRKGAPFDAKHLDAPGAKQMTYWFDFASRTRWWDLEPYFDVDGGRCLALEGIEYILYIEKPSGPVEVLTLRHGYDVFWFNPVTGELAKQKKDFKGEKFVGEPPDRSHDWVLHLAREGRIESMNRSYKFESRPVPIQEIEANPQKVPYEIAEPAGGEISVSKPAKFEAKVKRDTRATRSMMFLWTGELVVEGQGYRVLGTGREGVLRIPPNAARRLPAVLNLRLSALNANGKAYSIDRVYRLVP